MADAYRFPPQSAANNYYYSQGTQPQQPRHQILRNSTPPNNTRSPFSGIDTPSPSRSPDIQSPAHNPYSMYANHQSGQHGRVNGGGRGGVPGMFNFNHQNSHQQQQHTQHHSGLQQDHNTHSLNGSAMGHHSNFSSGVLTSSTPSFAPQGLQNGHAGTTRGGQAQQINEHWSQQLILHKETQQAHAQMTDAALPHHYARAKAGENRGITSTSTTTQEVDNEERTRIPNTGDPAFSKRQDWYNLDMSGLGLRVLTSPVFDYAFIRELYVASNKISELPASIGKLRGLSYLDVSNNQLRQLPPELGMCVYLKNLLLFDNFLDHLPTELGSLYQLEMLGVEGNPLNAEQKQLIVDRGTKEMIHQLRESAPVPLPPQPRVILDLSEGISTANQDKFKVFSYNILCDNATRSQYNYTPSEALKWDFRKQHILQEIEAQDADIVCLQEVDVDSYKEFFNVKLAYHDYKGVFWPKARAKTMSEKDAKMVDGCATYYKNSKYILLDKHLIDFANVAINRPDMKNQNDIFNRVMPRDQMAVVTFFENRATGSRLIVANGHLFWDPAYPDVKLIQTAILMDSINRQAEKWARQGPCKDKDKKIFKIADDDVDGEPAEPLPEPAPSMEYTNSTQIPLVACVDLNSTADSSPFELLSKGRVGPEHQDLKGFSYGNFSRDGIEHPFSLKSAYSALDETTEKLEFTNYTPGFVGVIDHIFYSTNALETTSLLGGVDKEYMKRVPGFPNYHFPSDHLSLLAEFAVKGRKEKKSHPEPDFGPSSRRDRRD